MARRRAVEVPTDDHEDIVKWYRRRLRAKAKVPKTEWDPVRIGPTWQLDGDRWLLPERSLGWDALGWCGTFLQHAPGRPWRFTDEQARFLLHWYAVDEAGVFDYRDGVLQRLKGWGKDPFGACVGAIELLGPARFSGEWGTSGALKGQPLGTDVPDAWVQTAAVSLDQTKNTTRLLPGLFTREAKALFGLQIGRELVHAMGDERLIQAVTSSPSTLEGARATFVLLNETHHWLKNNDGHEMAAVIERNATKSADGAARTLRITNAFEPGENSVAQQDREAHDSVLAGRHTDTGLLYDSLEAPPDAPLTAEDAPAVVRSIRGDSTWLDVDRIVKSILDPRNPASRSRRFWYNQITATEDAWVTPQEWDRLALAGWVVPTADAVTLGFDGSKSDDHCALIGCHIDNDHLFELDIWVPVCPGCASPEPAEKCGVCGSKATAEVDRADIDRQVRQALNDLDVVGFYSDLHPWESYVDTWAEEFGDDLLVKAGPRHAIAWDIRSRNQTFTAGTERMHDAIIEGTLSHDGSERTRQHFHNARRAPNQWGVSVRKEHRESARKIDAVPAAVLARMARSDFLALPPGKRKRKKTSGAVWGA